MWLADHSQRFNGRAVAAILRTGEIAELVSRYPNVRSVVIRQCEIATTIPRSSGAVSVPKLVVTVDQNRHVDDLLLKNGS